MGLELPTEGASPDVWDLLLNTALGVTGVDGHDHTTGKGVRIPSAALNINADVSWASGGSNYAITDIAALDFAAVTAASVVALQGALFVNTVDSELYFRSVAGTNIKITDGTTLNVSIVGGIGGDYSAVSALFDYDDATDTYRARQEEDGGVRQFAKLSIADLIIREYDPAGDATVPVETVTIKSPDGLAASYALTLPAALPGSTSVVTLSATGQIIAGARTRTTTENVGATSWLTNDLDAGVGFSYLSGGIWVAPGANHTSFFLDAPIDAPVGATVSGFSLSYTKGTNATFSFNVILYKRTGTAAGTAISSTTINTNAPGAVTLAITGLAEVIAAGTNYYVQIIYTAPANTDASADSFHNLNFTQTVTLTA